MSSFKGTNEDPVVWLLVIHFDVSGSIPRSIHFFQFLIFSTKVKTVETLGSSTLSVLNRALISINACLMTNYDIKLKKKLQNRFGSKNRLSHRFPSVFSELHRFSPVQLHDRSDNQLESVTPPVHGSIDQISRSESGFKTMLLTKPKAKSILRLLISCVN